MVQQMQCNYLLIMFDIESKIYKFIQFMITNFPVFIPSCINLSCSLYHLRSTTGVQQMCIFIILNNNIKNILIIIDVHARGAV